MSSRRQNNNIIRQINRPVVIVEVLMILLSSALLFLYNISHNIRERYDNAIELGFNSSLAIEDYECLSFLIDYWQEHYAEMELVYHNDEKLCEKEKLLREKNSGFTKAARVTSEEAEQFDPESQRLLAEICYTELSSSFDDYKLAFAPLYLYSFVIKDGQMFFLVTGANVGEVRASEGGELFEFGSCAPYTPGVYPRLDETLLTGEISDKMELSMNKGADRSVVHAFVPVYEDHEMVMIVGVSMMWKDMILPTLGVSFIVALSYTLFFTVLGLIFMRLLKKKVVVPIRATQEIIGGYAQSKDAAAAVSSLDGISSDNEIEELAGDFGSMIKELECYMADIMSITAEKERIGAELDMAKEIQAGQLPSVFPAFPDRTEFDICATMTPAKEVGGDFYDFFFVDDDHLALVIADVSGKGVPAALFMMMSKILINYKRASLVKLHR